MISSRVRVVINPNFGVAIHNDIGVKTYTGMQAKLIKFHAWRRFQSMVKHTHPVTPPPYAESFFTRSFRRGHVTVYAVGNDDPVADLVEFGAHPRGGPTATLGYRPLGAGIDAVMSGA